MVNSLLWQTGVCSFALQSRRQPSWLLCGMAAPVCVCADYNENAFETTGHMVPSCITLPALHIYTQFLSHWTLDAPLL